MAAKVYCQSLHSDGVGYADIRVGSHLAGDQAWVVWERLEDGAVAMFHGPVHYGSTEYAQTQLPFFDSYAQARFNLLHSKLQLRMVAVSMKVPVMLFIHVG